MQTTTTKVNGSSATTESSMLFSLASLGAMAAERPAPPRPVARVDELLGIGALPAPALAAPVVPPVVAPPRVTSSAGRWIAAASILAVAILGGSYAAARSLVQAPTHRPAVLVAVVDPIATTPLGIAPPTSDVETPPAAEIETPPVVVAPDPTPTPRHPHVLRPTPAPVADPVTTPAPTPEPPATRLPHSVAELLATPPEPHAHPVTPPPAPTAATTPTRPEVLAAMRALTPAVTACGGGAHGLATVSVRMSSSGHVTSAVVNGDFAGTPTGSCIARAVRAAEVPAFTQSTFGFDYPFRL